MKLTPRSFIFRIFLLFVISFTSNISFAQWEEDVRIGPNDQYTSQTNDNNRCIAANGNYVHAVWYKDIDDHGYDIFYRRSLNNGVTWEPEIRLTNDSLFSWFPAIAVSNNAVHIVWMDNAFNTSVSDIYYRRSTNNGLTWQPVVRLTNSNISIGGFSFPSVSASGSYVDIAWDNDMDSIDICHIRSANDGVTWGQINAVTYQTTVSTFPAISSSGQNIHISWGTSSNDIYYINSTNGGSSWGIKKRLNDSLFALRPSITNFGSNVCVVWQNTVWNDSNGIYSQIRYKHSTNNGVNWSSERTLVPNEGSAVYPCIYASGSILQLAWISYNKVFYKRSTNGGIDWSVNTQLTFHPSSARFASIAAADAGVHVLWTEARLGNEIVFYKRNPTGNVGIRNISSGISMSYELKQNYPNPFNPNTKIRFSIPSNAKQQTPNVRLRVYDVSGKLISQLVNMRLNSGEYEVDFNAGNLASGIYFYELHAGDFKSTKKMILQK